ncbi:MAG: ATP phosphoribosyltransferase [Thermoanaerobaculia bacterium]|nr:ATP phosphoribosyltransferase [Thermoanaerobaculia bacterium]
MKAQTNLPRGVQAFLFESAERRRRAEERTVAVLRSAGLKEVILPVLDFADPYAAVQAHAGYESYRFVDRQGDLLALRSDFTPMAARVLAPRLPDSLLPAEFFYRGDIVRDEASGLGRLREFSQAGAEHYGEGGVAADQRMLELLLSCVAFLGGERLTLTLGFAGLLERVLSLAAPGLDSNPARLCEVMSAARGRRVAVVERTLRDFGARSGPAEEAAVSLLSGFDLTSSLLADSGLASAVDELRAARAVAESILPGITTVVDLAGTPTSPYYTGLTFGLDARGVSAPLALGGRYDNLLAEFGRDLPAVGFSVSIEALALASEVLVDETPATGARVRIAVGKGRLLKKTLAILGEAGVAFPEPDGRRLVVPDLSGEFELLLLKDDDVPTYVAHGSAALGIVGSDRVAESGEPVLSPVDLGFGTCRLSLIGRAGEEFHPNGHPVVVGTKYQRLARAFFDERRISHEIVPLAGSVELAAALHLTDVVVDLIETGSTMKANGLAEIETILTSEAVLIAGRSALTAHREAVTSLVTRLCRKGAAPC